MAKYQISQLRLALQDHAAAAKQALAQGGAAAGQYRYSRAIVTFFDILGFRDLVTRRDADDVGRILSTLRKTSVAAPAATSESDPAKVISFSDSIVRSRLVSGQPSARLMHEELIDTLQAQLFLAFDGVFIRGGMSIAEIYMSDSQVFGPGLVRAYDLESNFATYPRVVLDPDLVAEFDLAEGESEAREALSLLTHRGDDGMYYGHYLGQLALGMPTADIDAALDIHKQRIIEGVGHLRGAPFGRAKQKFSWLARYHNQSCDELGFSHSRHIIEFEDLGLAPIVGAA